MDSSKLEVHLLSQEKETLEKSIDIKQAKIIKLIELLGKQ
jgi:hypothetical protein